MTRQGLLHITSETGIANGRLVEANAAPSDLRDGFIHFPRFRNGPAGFRRLVDGIVLRAAPKPPPDEGAVHGLDYVAALAACQHTYQPTFRLQTNTEEHMRMREFENPGRSSSLASKNG